MFSAPRANRARAAAVPTPLPPPLRIQRHRRLLRVDGRELWQFKGLLAFLIWRDVRVRYKQTFLGPTWAVLRPFLQMVIMTVIFGHLVGVSSQTSAPYPIFVFSGLLAWMYFSSTLTNGASSVIGNGNIVGKAYFPRLFIPIAAVATPVVDLLLSFIVLIGMFIWYRNMPSWHIVFLPAFILLAGLLGCGCTFLLSALTVRFRDVPFVLPFIIQIWMYATPVIYPVTLVPAKYRWIISLNPLTGVIDGFRWSLLGTSGVAPASLFVAAIIGMIVLVAGLMYFRAIEPKFADLL